MSGSHGHGHSLDQYATLQSPIHRWDARLKMVGLVAIIVAFALIESLYLLPGLIAIALSIYALARLPWRYLVQRLKLPGYFISALLIFMPFVAGSAAPENLIVSFGPLDIRQQGVVAAVLVAVRFFAIFTVALVLFSTATFLTSIKALRALKFPDLLADMVLLTFRYLYEIGAYFGTMRRAARLRGFQGSQLSLGNIKTLASLLGHMFVRSFEQSERVYRAMVLRGYGAGKVRKDSFVAVSADYIKLAIALIIAASLIILQFTI